MDSLIVRQKVEKRRKVSDRTAFSPLPYGKNSVQAGAKTADRRFFRPLAGSASPVDSARSVRPDPWSVRASSLPRQSVSRPSRGARRGGGSRRSLGRLFRSAAGWPTSIGEALASRFRGLRRGRGGCRPGELPGPGSKPPAGQGGGLLGRLAPSSPNERKLLILCAASVAGALLLALGAFALWASERSFPLPSALSSVAQPEGAPSLLDLLVIGQQDDPVDDDQATLAPIPPSLSTTTYVLPRGQSLAAVAKRFGVSLDAIMSMNKISNAASVRAGAALKIPNIDGVLHTVRRGESLSSIATHYKVNRVGILDANDLETAVLRPGQQLFIPGGKMDKPVARKSPVITRIFSWPVRGGISSWFGGRADPFSGEGSVHKGIDIVADYGSAVKAALDGTVAETGYSAIYGNYVILSHANGYQTFYCHFSSTAVSDGQKVTKGQQIGCVGTTGYSTGAHLHFGVYKNGVAVNPIKYLVQ